MDGGMSSDLYNDLFVDLNRFFLGHLPTVIQVDFLE